MNKTLIKQIAIFPIVMYALQQYTVSSTMFYCLVIACIAIFCVLNEGRLVIPQIIGFRALIFYQAITIFIGIICGYSFRDIIRDVFYTSIVVLVLWLGYAYGIKGKREKDILYSMVVLALLLTFVNFFTALINIVNWDFETFRTIMNTNIHLISLGFIVSYISFFCPIGLTPRLTKWGMISFGINLLLCMSRGIILATFCGIFVITIFVLKNQGNKSNVIRVFLAVSICVLIVNVGFNFLPETIINTFSEKMLNSSQEISVNQSFTTMKAVSNNWRGYEMSQVHKLMRNGNAFQLFFGYGAGKQIPVPYFKMIYASTEVADIAGDTIPLLHNGYYTILVKGGILGVFIYLLFFFYNFKKAIYGLRSSFNGYQLVIVGFIISIAIQMYVTRGLAEQTVNWWWCFVIGWITAINRTSRNAQGE